MKTTYFITITVIILMLIVSCSQKSYNIQPAGKVQAENKAQQIISQNISNEAKTNHDAFRDFESTDGLDLAMQELNLIE